MKRSALLGVVALLATVVCVKADLYWGNSVAITDNLGTALTASETDPTVGCFAQLILANGSTANPFQNSGSGVSGGDTVMDTIYAGMGDMFYTDGIFPQALGVSGSANNGYYYVRVFDAAQATLADWNQGNAAPIPSTASYYWQSDVHSYAHVDGIPDQWDFAPSGGSTMNLIAVPEPTTLAFLGLGFGALILRKKMRK